MSALIAYRNLADSAIVTGPENAGFPLTNLATRQLSTKWRGPNTGVEIVIDLLTDTTVRLVAMLSHNMLIGQTISVYSSPDGTSWTFVAQSVSTDLGVPDLPQNAFVVIDGGVLTRYVKVSMAGAPLAYLEAGRLWIGDALVIPYGANSDWGIKTRERGTVDESDGLEIYPSKKPNGRELRMSFSPTSIALAYGTQDGVTALNVPSFQDLHTYASAIGEVIAFPRSSGIWPRRVGVYGRLTEDSLDIRHLAGPNYSTDVRVIEER
jgi:hypothetical protein